MNRFFARTGWLVMAASFAVAAPASAQTATFRSASTFSLPGQSSDATSLLAIADVGSLAGPADGRADVIVAAQNQQVAVLFGRGDGRLAGGPNTQLGRIPSALAVAAFNDDAALDLLVADTGNNLACFRGFSDGPPFERQGDLIRVGENPVAIATHDFDDDDTTDIAVLHQSNQTFGEVWILLGNGDCSFAAPPFPADAVLRTGAGSSAIAVSDLDGDGDADIAVTNATGNDVWVFRADAEGAFTEVQRVSVVDPLLPPATGGGSRVVEPIGIGVGNFDGDSNPDLVVVNRNTDQIVLLPGNGDATFATPRYFPSGSAGSSPTSLAVGDIDGDGVPDVVVANNRSSDASVLLGDGAGGLRLPRVFVADQEPLALGVANFDGDGLLDLVVSSRGNQGPTAAVLLGGGDGSMKSVENVPTDPSPADVAVGDLDNDGLPDLATANGSGVVLLARARYEGGFTPIRGGEIDAGGSLSAIAAADFDGDLLTDIVVAKDDEGEVGFFRGTPTGRFADEVATAVGVGLSALATGDWNEDGFADIALSRQLGDDPGRVELLFGSPTGPGRLQSFLVGLTPVDIASGDFDNDGSDDLLVANNVSGFASVLLGGGDGTFAAGTAVAVGGSPRALAVADFDRDGCDDFVVALSVNSAVVPFFGACNGSFVRGPQTLSGVLSPAGLFALDFSGDGIPDAIVSDEVDNQVSLYTKRPNDRFFLNLPNDDYVVSRRPVRMAAGDFDGDGRYDGVALNSFVAGSASVLTNVAGAASLRGDANGDAALGAADLIGVQREIVDGDGRRSDDAAAGFNGGTRADANGDGIIARQDARAVVARIFPRS